MSNSSRIVKPYLYLHPSPFCITAMSPMIPIQEIKPTARRARKRQRRRGANRTQERVSIGSGTEGTGTKGIDRLDTGEAGKDSIMTSE